jgi:predicted PurR-regulated permease PerM
VSTDDVSTDEVGTDAPGAAGPGTGSTRTPPTVHLTPRSIVRAVVIVAALFVVFTVATRATDTLWWFAQAVVIAAVTYPVVQRLRRHVPAAIAVLGLTVVVGLVFGLLAAVVMGELRDESAVFRASVPRAVDRLERTDGIGRVIDDLRLDDTLRELADELADRVQFRGPDLPGLATEVGGRVSAVFVVWILTVMLVFTGTSMVEGMVGLLPDRRRDASREVLRLAYGRTVRYLGLTSLRSLVVLGLTFMGCRALGLGMPGLLALLAAVLAFVPFVGVLVGGLPVVLMTLLDGTLPAVAVLAVVLALQTVDALVVQRRIDDRSLPLGLFPTLAAAMIGFSLRGPGGLLIAVAVVAMVVAVVNDTGAVRSLRTESPVPR